MVKDCMDYERSCKPCQFHANFIHQPPEPLHPTTMSWSFDSWGMDMVGPMLELAEENIYILAATDYFSKWAESVALLSGRKEEVADFIESNIIYLYGVPRCIITNNGKSFDNKFIADLFAKFKLRKYHSSMYYLQANSLAEAFNKTLCNTLKKVVNKSKKNWHEKMEEALWAYRTTHRMLTQATPCALVYGVEVVLPLEVQILSLRMVVNEGFPQEEPCNLGCKSWTHLTSSGFKHDKDYWSRISKSYNKKVRQCSYQVGVMVLAVKRPIYTLRKNAKMVPK
ncbi:hypothetical protein LIER_04188 [Lithospermum erythrorhizon]